MVSIENIGVKVKVSEVLRVVEHLGSTNNPEYAKLVEKLFTEIQAQKLETVNIIIGYEAEMVKLGIKSVSELSAIAIKRYHELMKELNTGKETEQ